MEQKHIATTLLIIFLLLIPVAIVAERSFDGWSQPLLARFAETEPIVQCRQDNVAVLGTAATGYTIVELTPRSKACGRP